MKYFVTGGTGFIGSHFIVATAQDAEIYALTRGDDRSRAAARLRSSLRLAADAYPAPAPEELLRTCCVVGDVELPDLGIAHSDLAVLQDAGIDTFWHFAANLSFEQDMAEAVQRVNVGGVRNALELATRIGVSHFVYTSTAYTTGPGAGVVDERLHSIDGPFNNPYEATKCAAEHLVADFCRERGMRFSILRPSVIVGVSSTKRSGGSSTGLYAFVRDLHMLKRAVGSMDVDPSFAADPDMVINLNPVDAVTADIRYLIENDFPGGPVYHLTADHGVRIRDALKVITSSVGLQELRLVSAQAEPTTPIDELIGRRAEFYRSYVFGEKQFLRSIPTRNGCSPADLQAFVDNYLGELEARYRSRRVAQETITTSDGVPVTVHRRTSRGTRGTILAVNAFGAPADFWHEFMNEAAGEFDVYVWETRYLPGDAPLDSTDVSLGRHVADAVDVAAHYGLEDVHLLGWCTGAKVALAIAHEHPDLLVSLTLLSGGFNLQDPALTTDYERRLLDTLHEIAESRDTADLYYDLIYAGGQESGHDDGSVRSLLNRTDPKYLQHTSLPFRSAENIYRYAQLITEFAASKDVGDLERLEIPTAVVTSRLDPNTHPDASRYIAERLPDAQLVEIDGGGHYLMDSHPADVLTAVRSVAAPARALDALAEGHAV